MKVLHIGKYFPPFFGGMENFMAQLLPVMQQDGLSQVALVHQHKPGFFKAETFSGFSLYRASCFGRLFFAPVSPWFAVELRRVIKCEDPDILHFHMPNTSVFWALLIPSARKLPWVVHWQSDVLGNKPRLPIRLLYPLYRIFEQMVLKRATAVICSSPGYLETSEPLRLFRQKCHVIPLGLPDSIPAHPHVVGETEKRPLRLLVVGRFSYYKGHRFLLDALAALPKENRPEVVLVGQGELKPGLEKQAGALQLDSVRFVGSVTDEQLHSWYNWCDCLCLPSIERTEAFGMVILEAARQGKPAIVTDVPGSGMNWVVQDQKTGWVVPAGDADALSEKLKELSTNPADVLKAGELAYQRFQSHFSIRRVAEQIAALYSSTLPEKS